MQENPYTSMLHTLRKDLSERSLPSWLIGTVVAAAPLSVRLSGHILSGKELLVNASILPRGEQVALSALKGSLSGTPAVSVGGGDLNAYGTFGGLLAPGDSVVLLPSGDGQQFLLLCKAVSA